MANITIDKACCKGCNICLTVCPKKIFVKSRQRNNYGTAMPAVENPEECIAQIMIIFYQIRMICP